LMLIASFLRGDNWWKREGACLKSLKHTIYTCNIPPCCPFDKKATSTIEGSVPKRGSKAAYCCPLTTTRCLSFPQQIFQSTLPCTCCGSVVPNDAGCGSILAWTVGCPCHYAVPVTEHTPHKSFFIGDPCPQIFGHTMNALHCRSVHDWFSFLPC